MASRFRAWCFTINNYSDNDIISLKRNIKYRYIILGDEIAPTTGTKHIQGYVYLANAITFESLKKKLPSGTHIEQAKGNFSKNKEYCSKQNILFEDGTEPEQGKRSDIERAREVVANGGSMRDIIDLNCGYQGIRTGEKVFQYCETRRNWVTDVSWFWGKTGTGKSRKANETLPNAWWSGKDLRWWQGYDGHPDVIIDDFRGDFCTFHELLRILDRYPYTIENKGGSRQLLAKRIIITCPKNYTEVYAVNGEQIEQLARRITRVEHFGDPDESCTLVAQKSGVILDPDLLAVFD